MTESKSLEIYKALADDALKAISLLLRQKRAGEILSEARNHLTREEFKDLEKHVFERLEK